MTQEEIISGNKLIFDFMGCVHSKEATIDLWEMSGLKYHHSWNDLMPVVEKIETLGFNVLIGFNTYVGIIKNEKAITDKTPKFESTHVVTEERKIYTWKPESKIQGLYITIIKFITWYNPQTH